jgi:hypothetical protein
MSIPKVDYIHAKEEQSMVFLKVHNGDEYPITQEKFLSH